MVTGFYRGQTSYRNVIFAKDENMRFFKTTANVSYGQKCGCQTSEVLSGLEEKAITLDIHMHFVAFLNIHYFFPFGA